MHPAKRNAGYEGLEMVGRLHRLFQAFHFHPRRWQRILAVQNVLKKSPLPGAFITSIYHRNMRPFVFGL